MPVGIRLTNSPNFVTLMPTNYLSEQRIGSNYILLYIQTESTQLQKNKATVRNKIVKKTSKINAYCHDERHIDRFFQKYECCRPGLRYHNSLTFPWGKSGLPVEPCVIIALTSAGIVGGHSIVNVNLKILLIFKKIYYNLKIYRIGALIQMMICRPLSKRVDDEIFLAYISDDFKTKKKICKDFTL